LVTGFDAVTRIAQHHYIVDSLLAEGLVVEVMQLKWRTRPALLTVIARDRKPFSSQCLITGSELIGPMSPGGGLAQVTAAHRLPFPIMFCNWRLRISQR